MSYRGKKKVLRSIALLLTGIAVGGAVAMASGMTVIGIAWVWMMSLAVAAMIESYIGIAINPELENEEYREHLELSALRERAQLGEALESSMIWRGVFSEWVRQKSDDPEYRVESPSERGALAAAALCYLKHYCDPSYRHCTVPNEWPLPVGRWRAGRGGWIGDLSRAVALVVAEIEYRKQEEKGAM